MPKFVVNSTSENSPIGYIFEVDPGYPNKLHVLHNGYPLAPEKIAIPYDTIPYQINVKKLLTNMK